MSLVKYAAQQLIVSKSKIVRHSQQMFRMSADSSDIIMEAHTPLLHCVVDDTLVKVFPLLHNALQQPFHSLDLLPVDSLLKLVSMQMTILAIFNSYIYRFQACMRDIKKSLITVEYFC